MNIDQFISKNADKMNDAQIAKEVGLTKHQVRHRREKLVNKTKPTVEQELTADRNARKYKESESVAVKKNKVLMDKLETLEDELEAMKYITDSVKPFVIKKTKGESSQATALWLASDWHVGEKVTLGQTNGINKYTPEIASKRGENFFVNGLKLTDMASKDVKVDTVIIALLGDFITGHLHLDAVENNYLAPAEEIVHAQNIIISGIEYVLANSTYKLIIPCHSGNHGRTTKYSHFGSENGHSLEYLMYHAIAGYFRNEKRVQVIISEGAHSYVDVYGFKIRFLHGHDVKFGGGVGGLTIPLNKAIAQWDKARPANLTCLGHFHQRFDGGNFLVNGSLIGYNSFALSIKASAEAPQQQFALIDSKRGKTIVAPIIVE